MKKVIFWLFILSIGVGGYIFYNSYQDTNIHREKESINKIEIAKKTEDNQKNITEEKLPDDSKLLSLDEPFLSQEISEETHKEDNRKKIISEIDIDTVNSKFPSRKDAQPIMAVEMDSKTISNLVEGSEVEIAIPNQTFVGVVEKKKYSMGKSIVITGVSKENSDYGFLITQGEKSSFATVHSVDGIYEIEMRDGIGYIYNAADLLKDKICTHPE